MPGTLSIKLFFEMTQRLINFIFIISLLIGCTPNDNERISKFENHLGIDKAEVLTEIVETFDSLLHSEFDCKSNYDCYILFLESVENQDDISFITNLPESKRLELKTKIVNTGLRKTIFEYEFEVRQDTSNIIQEIFRADCPDSLKNEHIANSDSVVNFKIFGNYVTGLELVQENDSALINYVDAIIATGGMSYSLLSSGLLYAHEHYGFSEYFLKRIVVTEFFLLYLNK